MKSEFEQEVAIKTLLMELGISARYQGYRLAVSAIQIVLSDSEVLQGITKRLYPCLAKRYDTSVTAVERNIHTLAVRAWTVAPEKMRELAGEGLDRPPATGKFLEMLAGKVKKAMEEPG